MFCLSKDLENLEEYSARYKLFALSLWEEGAGNGGLLGIVSSLRFYLTDTEL
jgi:hypothetical protein